MKKAIQSIKNPIAVLLAAVLVATTVLSVIAQQVAGVANSDEPEWVTSLTLQDSKPAAGAEKNTGTRDHYSLLKDKNTGITMSAGETYIFEMDIYVGPNNADPKTGQLDYRHFGFNLLDGANAEYADITFLNAYCGYRQKSTGYIISSNKKFTLWQGAKYHITYTVNAYDSIQVKLEDYDKTGAKTVRIEESAPWDDVWSLTNCTEDSNTVFKPNLMFRDIDGTVSDIRVTRSGAKPDVSDWVGSLTLQDSNPASGSNKNTGTMDYYSLLKDKNAGITMSNADTYIFEMDIYVGPNNADPGTGQLDYRHFGFNLLDGANAEYADITFLNAYCGYRQKGTNYIISSNKKFTLWQQAKYHITYTVNAYKNIQVKLESYDKTGAKTVQIEESAPWEDIWSLANCTESSKTVFRPNLMFRDIDGKVTDIKVTHLENVAPPVQGIENINFAEGKVTSVPFDGNVDKIFDLGETDTVGEKPEWCYSGTFRYDEEPENGNGIKVIFANGAYKGSKKDLAVSAQVQKENGTQTGTRLVLSAGDGELFSDNCDIKFEVGKDYVFTVQVSENKAAFWINDERVLKPFDLTEAGVTELTPKFGINAGGSKGEINNVKVWGDFKWTSVPYMNADDENIAEGKTLPNDFSGNADVAFDLGEVNSVGKNPTWYYSGVFGYEELAETGGLTLCFAEGMHGGAKKDITASARVIKKNGEVTGTQIVLETGYGGTVLLESDSDIKYSAATGYLFTVKVSGGKVTFWINDNKLVDGFDLNAAGVTGITPKFGLNANGTVGKISDIAIWGDLEGPRPETKPETVANLIENCEEIIYFRNNARKYYDTDKVKVKGNSWYYSGKFTYDSIPTWGGLTFVFAEATYTSSTVSETREISVTARSGGFSGNERKTQAVVWANSTAIDPLVKGVSGLSYETGKTYTWTVEVEDGLMSFWINKVLVYDKIDLTKYGITNLKPKFGIFPDGSQGSMADVEVWDTETTDIQPIFGSKDTNKAVLKDVSVTAGTGRQLFAGVSFTDGGEYYYSADVAEKSGSGNIRLIVAEQGDQTVELYFDGAKAHIVKHSGSRETEIAANAATGIAKPYKYTVKYSAGKISFWVNDIILLSKISVDGAVPTAGIASGGAAGTVTDIKLWGDVSKADGAVYQKFADISSYRGRVKTYPEANGYVFGGWYNGENDSSPLSENTNGGSAYAKMVPSEVLQVKTQILKNTTSASKKTNLRFVTTVDSLQYRQIKITLTNEGKTREFSGKEVYKSIKVADGEAAYTSPRNKFCDSSKYFFTVNVKNVSSFDSVWTAVPGWTTLDGTNVTGAELKVAVSDELNKLTATK